MGRRKIARPEAGLDTEPANAVASNLDVAAANEAAAVAAEPVQPLPADPAAVDSAVVATMPSTQPLAEAAVVVEGAVGGDPADAAVPVAATATAEPAQDPAAAELPAPSATALPAKTAGGNQGFATFRMAAALAVAVGMGVLAGAYGATGFRPSGQPSLEAQRMTLLTREVAALGARIDALGGEIAAGSAGLENRLAALSARFDTADRARADQAVTLARIGETMTGLAAQQAATRSVSPEVTGAIAPQRRGGETQDPVTLAGWELLDVFQGRAIVGDRRFGVFEVAPGARLPGAGTVETIERRAGRWVVVTENGLIAAGPEARSRRF